VRLKTELLGSRRIPYLHGGEGETLFYLHGLGLHPRYSRRTLERLAEDFEVVAPVMYGVNCLSAQPTSVDEYAELTSEFERRFEARHVVGHSLGASVGITAFGEGNVEHIVAINPMMPVDYGVSGFLMRATKKWWKELQGMGEAGSTQFAVRILLPFAANTVRALPTNLRLAANLQRFGYNGVKAQVPTRVLYGEDDEYFDLDERSRELFERMGVEVRTLPGHNHDWPLFSPNRTAAEVNEFVNGHYSR
jgi:pimeloyl-ACP methyl ester carboxylesterase